MGFNNWNSTHCGADFNEAMIKGIADIFVAKGLKAAGYEYVNLDDCWAKKDRDANGKLVPDTTRFPNGIKAVADYVHSKGLKFGIYTSAGTTTCAQAMPGALGHEYSDAQQFADWGVDYLKYDNCNNQGVDAKKRYITMRDALKATGRPIVYSICEWGENKRGSGRRTSGTCGAPPVTSVTCGTAWSRSSRRTRRWRRTPVPATGTTPTCWRSATAG